ncbi:MAG: hypothetical protein ABI615_07780 [Chthoniobacterales bacterium]
MSLFRRNPRPCVAISMRPTRSPWGGSSPFVWQLHHLLVHRGYDVIYHLRRKPDLIFVIDPRKDHPAKRITLQDLVPFRKEHPEVPIVHRINECDQRKGTDFMDELLRETNALCDYTVFIAEWLRDYFVEKWFDASTPHSCIYNGADPKFYHPIGYRLPKTGEPVRIVTHHWSDNPMKGFDVYEKIDHLIADGTLKGFEQWVIGRWPENIRWKSSRLFRPMTGQPLAEHLRQCHFYVTASRWEPCGMHHVEGAQCGLPLLYHEDGGGIVEAGRKYGLGFRDNLVERIHEMAARLPEFHDKVLNTMPSGDRMALDYADVIQKLIAKAQDRRTI